MKNEPLSALLFFDGGKMSLGYSYEDVHRYFNGSYVVVDGRVGYMSGPGNTRDCFYISYDKDNKEVKEVDYKTFAWKDLQCSALGYRHLKDGLVLVNVTKRAARNTAKGVGPNTLRADAVPEVRVCYEAARKAAEYKRSLEDWRSIAEQLFKPTFVSSAEAEERLLSTKHPALGLALSPELAMTVDPTTDNSILLLHSGVQIGRRVNGRWEWDVNYGRDVAARAKVRV